MIYLDTCPTGEVPDDGSQDTYERAVETFNATSSHLEFHQGRPGADEEWLNEVREARDRALRRLRQSD